jgi:hypothetical protein
MAYTFGANSSDSVIVSGTGNPCFQSGRCLLAAGWFLPTTLTATRRLWAIGTTGPEVDTTTSELRMRVKHATTNGQWTTTGAGLAVNEWRFLVWYWSGSNTGPVGIWRVWSGTIDTPPVACTITQAVAPVGNLAADENNWIAGNNNGPTLSWQGDIGEMWLHGNNAAGFGVAAATSLSADEEELIYHNYVIPLWRSETKLPIVCSFANTLDRLYWPALASDTTSRIFYGEGSSLTPVNITTRTATYSAEREPRVRFAPGLAMPLPHYHHRRR